MSSSHKMPPFGLLIGVVAKMHGSSGSLSRGEMLAALQADVDRWPQRVKKAGVVNAGGSSYVPLPRNNAILRTPHDPEETYAYMINAWAVDSDTGSEGWYRIIEQAGPELTWEWLMVEELAPYAPLFSAELRERVRRALVADAGYVVWANRLAAREEADRERATRVAQLRAEIRAGTRARSFPELDHRR